MPSLFSVDRSLKKSRGVTVRVTGSGAVFTAACILILPMRWFLSAMAAAIIHELCHIAALKACKVNLISLEIGIFGAKIQTASMMPAQQLICAAAGPIGSLLLLLLAKWAPLLSLMGLLHGIFNLLPVYPMDGGRILESILTICFPNRPVHAAKTIEKGIGILSILVLAAILFHIQWGRFAILLLISLILRMLGRNIACKDDTLGLQ